MEAHAAPITRREQRRFDEGIIGRAVVVIVVNEAEPLRLTGRIGALVEKVLFRWPLWSGKESARHPAFGAARPDAMLHIRHLARMPAVEEVAEDAAVPAQLAVI